MERVRGENRPKLLDHVPISLRTNRQRLGDTGYCNRKTEESYSSWIKHSIIFNIKIHSKESNKKILGHKSVKGTMVYTHALKTVMDTKTLLIQFVEETLSRKKARISYIN